ncbi:hypothetical protein L6V77_34520 [Myxococcota bacterium]|nr:hypothetical protein [Myxococcota bacterium]
MDEQRRHSPDGPTGGFILCQSKSRALVECGLRDMTKPVGAAADPRRKS